MHLIAFDFETGHAFIEYRLAIKGQKQSQMLVLRLDGEADDGNSLAALASELSHRDDSPDDDRRR